MKRVDPGLSGFHGAMFFIAWMFLFPQMAHAQEDFGDAPMPYPTLQLNNGAQHTIAPGVTLGLTVDAELDGQPDPNAQGDDTNNLADEDGVVFLTQFIPGEVALLNVTVSVGGILDAWFDYDQDGIWTAVEGISIPVGAGVNLVNVAVPADAVPGNTYARFRFNTIGPLPVDGPAVNGEVEDYEIVIVGLDYGDAPDPAYPTFFINNGARHTIAPGVSMGLLIDAEPEGQAVFDAQGDDGLNLDDEDGVVFVAPLIQGAFSQVEVTVTVAGWLDAWVDFDLNGIWDVGEQIVANPVVPGANLIAYFVPAAAIQGPTFARFRYNIAGLQLPPDGLGPDGEVEDYEVFVQDPNAQWDYGDADLPYPTLFANNGARHVIIPGVFMGAQIDAEADGQPDPNAFGDDNANLADEDGVFFNTLFIPGEAANVDVEVSAFGWLDAWFDFDQNGVWDAAELAWSGAVVPGLNPLNFQVPQGATPGLSVARFRYNLGGPLPVDGPAFDGEVEDYQIFIESVDYGDAPDAPYPTLLANNGARHVIAGGVFMGAAIDGEPDGQANANALGDDLLNIADEDGVAFVSPLIVGMGAQLDVTVSVFGWLDAWFDFDQDGVWTAVEQVISQPVVPGLNPMPIFIPAGATLGETYARFRYNTVGPVAVDGLVLGGEVEDYEVTIFGTDFGDAPPPYPTTLALNGAWHAIVPNVMMGAAIDSEPDANVNILATADDNTGIDDEDGVVFPNPLVSSTLADVDITVSVAGRIDAWVDFDQDQAWSAAEQIFTSQPVAAGLNSLNFNIPAMLAPGMNTVARFRFSFAGGLQPDGAAPDGEVEDYRINIAANPVNVADDVVPTRFALHEAVPNPFNPMTTLSFSLPNASPVRLTIHDVRGRLVRTLVQESFGAGVHKVVWYGRDDQQRQVASGVYLYRIQAGRFEATKRIVLVR